MITLPITVLAYEGPMARAYLGKMRRSGFKPASIVLMVLSHHPATGKKVGGFLPQGLRVPFCEKNQALVLNYWPQQIKSKQSRLYNRIAGGMEEMLPGSLELLGEMYASSFSYNDFSDSIERIFVSGLGDEALQNLLEKEQYKTVLFTGGGIVPKKLLTISGTRFIHAHPGYLPNVRGADGMLWSMLVRGRPGVSVFYMVPGIDMGDIIYAHDFPPLRILLDQDIRPDNQTLYRAIFSFCDPLLRAEVLVENVFSKEIEDYSNLSTVPQQESEGITYHFLHPQMRGKGLESLFPV